MKNIIPVVIAVVLGLAAVFAVSRVMSEQRESQEKKVKIVAASQALDKDTMLNESYIYAREVSTSSLPLQYILWKNKDMVIGQKTLYPIGKGDYILLSNIGLPTGLSTAIAMGEWGVTVSFADSTLLKVLQPGDEIAIIGIYKVEYEKKTNKDSNVEPEKLSKQVSTVIYPRVRILEKLGGSSIVLSMPPRQAIALTNIQQRCELYPMLRRRNDPKGLNRKDGGIFEDIAINRLADDLELIDIPQAALEERP